MGEVPPLPPPRAGHPACFPMLLGFAFSVEVGAALWGGPSPQAYVSAAACHRAGRRQMTQMNLQTQISAESPEVDRWAN